MKKYFIIALICVILDQIVKTIVVRNYPFSKNYGAVFGLFEGYVGIIIVLSFFALGFLIYYSDKVRGYGMGLVIGGITGNLIDRSVYGYVIDYIKISVWPAFNLADVFTVAGVIMLILYLRNVKTV